VGTPGLIAVAVSLVLGSMNGASILRAQSSPVFEVASVTRQKSGERHVVLSQFLPAGRFRAAGLPLKMIIAVAYNVPFRDTQLSGGPDWIRSREEVYDIEGEADADALKGLTAKDRADKMRLMLQALLADRFKLAIRRDTKEQSVYVLPVGKNGPNLHKSKFEQKDCDDPANQCHFGGAGQGQGIHVKAFEMAELVVAVSNFTDRP
jgi:uncharacterized protein (TIGR03435 family)